ncbi:MAG: ATP synthase F1 subunit epsilon [Polyangiaceae bacterium]
MASLSLEIVTPSGVVLAESVDEVVAPSVQGEFGVLAGHLPMLAALHTGLLHYKKGGESVDVAVGTGFAEVINDKAIILTDRFITKEKVEVLEVRERLKEVDAALEQWDGDLEAPERLELIEEEQWLATQLELYGDPPVPKVLALGRTTDYSNIMPPLADDPLMQETPADAEHE